MDKRWSLSPLHCMSFQQKCCINPLSPIRQLNCLSPLIGFIKPLNTYLTNVAPQRSLRATERASLLVNELMSLKYVSIKVRVEIKSVDLFLYLTSDTYAELLLHVLQLVIDKGTFDPNNLILFSTVSWYCPPFFCLTWILSWIFSKCNGDGQCGQRCPFWGPTNIHH